MENKIIASLDSGQIKVHADFFKGKKKVHEINTAFPLDSTEEQIQTEVEKAGELFVQEQEQAKEQAIVDEKYNNANNVISNLNK